MADVVEGGTASVEIEANITVNEESLAAASAKIADAFANGGGDATPRSEKPRGRGKTAAVDGGTAKIAVDQAKLGKDVQSAVGKDTYKISFDVGDLRAQIEEALSKPFTITVNAEMRGAMAQHDVGTAHGPTLATGAATSRGAPPEDVTKALTATLKDAIDNVYRNVNEAYAAGGKGRFGKQNIAPGNQAEKAMELMDRFGTKFSDMLQVQGPVNRAVGGSLSPQELGKALGIDPNHPALTALHANALGFTSPNPSGGITSRATDVLFARLQKWAQSTPMTAQPASAEEPVAQAVQHALRAEGSLFRTGNENAPSPASDELKAADKVLRAAMTKLPFQSVEPVDYMKKYEVDRSTKGKTPRAPRPDDDPEATARANQQLGPGERANNRRLIGGFVPREVNGIKVDLEPLLKAARGEGSDRGAFSGFFRTGEGDLKRFAPQNEDEQARVEAASRNRRSFTVGGIKGQVTNVTPSEAFWDAVTKVYDDEITSQLRQDPQVVNMVRQSLTQGAARRPLVEPHQGATNERGGIVSGTGHGFEGGYRAAFQLKTVLDDIDKTYAQIEDRQGSGKSTEKLEQHLDRLHARRSDLAEKALDIEPRSPAEMRAMDAAQKARDAQVARESGGVYRNESQRQVGRMTGLSEEELAKRSLTNPTLVGRAGREDIEAGRLPDLESIKRLILQKYEDPNFAGRRTLEGGGEETFPESSKQAMGRAFREVTGPLRAQLPEKGPVRKRGEQMLGDVYRGLFGESDKFERTANAPQAVNNRSQTGGLMAIANEEAIRAANLMDAGKGKGFVPKKTSRSTATGRHSNSGGVEVEPDYMRPATALDAERQELLGRAERAAKARAAAELQARQDAQRAALRRFPGVHVAVHGGDESITGEGAADYKEFLARSTASRLAKIPAAEDHSKRLNQIRSVQKKADEALLKVRDITGGKNEQATAELQRSAISGMGLPAAVQSEALDVLKSRTAATARSPYIRDTKDPATGDEMRARFLEKGGMAAASTETPAFAAFNKGIAGAATGGQGGGGRLGEVTGPIHVIIDGQPIRVTMEGAGAGGGGRPPRGRVTAEGGDEQPQESADGTPKVAKPKPPPGRRRKNLTARDIGVVADSNKIYSYLPGNEQQDRENWEIQSAYNRGDTTHGQRLNREIGMARGGTAESGGAMKPNAPVFGERTASGGYTTPDASETMAASARSLRARELAASKGPPATAAEKHFLDTFERVNKPETTAGVKRGLVGVPSRERAAEEARRAGVDVNFNDPRGVSGLLTSAPDPLVLRINAARQRAQRSLPQRAIGTSVVQIAENLFGGLEGPQQRLAVLANRTQDVQQLGVQRSNLTAARRGIIAEQRAGLSGIRATEAAGGDATLQRARFVGLNREFVQLTKQSHLVGKAMEEGAREVDQLAKSAVTGSDILRNLAAGAVGGIAGGLVTGVISSAIGGVSQVASAVIDKALGNVTEVNAVRTGLGDQTRQASGNAGVAVGQLGATTGLAGATLRDISPTLTRTAQIEAGNKALTDQLNVLRLAQDSQKRGTEAGVSQTLGGAFGTALGGTAPATESIGDFFKGVGRAAPLSTGKGAGGSPTGPLNVGEPLGRNFDVLRERINYLNQFLDKGGKSLVHFTDAATLSASEVAKQSQELSLAGAPQLRPDVTGAALVDSSGKIADATTSLKALADALANASKPSPEALLAANEPQRRAQVGLEFQQRQFALGTTNPQQTAIANLAQPTPPAATGINLSGLSKGDQKRLNADLAQTDALQRTINADTQVGVAAAKAFVSARLPDAGADFAKSLDLVGKYGQDISKIQIGVQTEQASLAAKQYSVQLIQANRSLNDAKGLTGQITKQNGDNLGVIERQTFLLQRQSQALGLGLSQKQINFQRAVASFQAPGLSSEEREARKQEAKLEADYAQKQLNIQKQLFGLSGSQFGISAKRNVVDLNRQVDLLTRGRTLVLDTAVAEKRIAVLTKLQAKENKNVETYYASAVQRTNDIMDLEAQLVAATGADMAAIGSIVLSEYAKTYQGMIDVINGRTPADTQESSSQGRNARHAAGFLGSVSGATSLGPFGVAGEAAGEAVAILKDPQKLMSPMGSSGGGRSVTVQIINPTVRNDNDLRKIVTDVKLALQKEASLVLPRRP